MGNRQWGMNRRRALVVVDTQVRYVDDAKPLHDRERFIANIQSLIRDARATKAPVVYIQHLRKTDDPSEAGPSAFDVHPSIAPLEGEATIFKRASDSFYQSD